MVMCLCFKSHCTFLTPHCRQLCVEMEDNSLQGSTPEIRYYISTSSLQNSIITFLRPILLSSPGPPEPKKPRLEDEELDPVLFFEFGEKSVIHQVLGLPAVSAIQTTVATIAVPSLQQGASEGEVFCFLYCLLHYITAKVCF